MAPNLPHRYQESGAGPGLCRVCHLTELAPIHQTKQDGIVDLPVYDGSIFSEVEAPAHYCRHKVTTVQLIRDWDLDFFLGNTVKYIERCRLKGQTLRDLQKAKKYLEMEIELIETGKLEKTITHG